MTNEIEMGKVLAFRKKEPTPEQIKEDENSKLVAAKIEELYQMMAYMEHLVEVKDFKEFTIVSTDFHLRLLDLEVTIDSLK